MQEEHTGTSASDAISTEQSAARKKSNRSNRVFVEDDEIPRIQEPRGEEIVQNPEQVDDASRVILGSANKKNYEITGSNEKNPKEEQNSEELTNAMEHIKNEDESTEKMGLENVYDTNVFPWWLPILPLFFRILHVYGLGELANHWVACIGRLDQIFIIESTDTRCPIKEDQIISLRDKVRDMTYLRKFKIYMLRGMQQKREVCGCYSTLHIIALSRGIDPVKLNGNSQISEDEMVVQVKRLFSKNIDGSERHSAYTALVAMAKRVAEPEDLHVILDRYANDKNMIYPESTQYKAERKLASASGEKLPQPVTEQPQECDRSDSKRIRRD